MKPAAEEAANIIVHYLAQVKSNVGFNPRSSDTFAEIEGAMQDLIDAESEAQKENRIATAKLFLRVRGDIEKLRIEVAALKRELATHKLPPDWTYAPGVQRVTPPPFAPDAPAPLGPMCVKPGEDLEQLPAERLSHVYNCDSCEQAMEQGDEDGDSR